MQVRGEGGKSEFEPALVVSFAGCPVGDCIGSEFPGHLDLRLGDKRAGDRGAEKVLGFVNGIPPNHRINEVVGKLIHQVESPVGGGPGGEGFFLETVEFFLLSYVGAVGDDLRILFVGVPVDEDGSVQTSRIGKYDFHE